MKVVFMIWVERPAYQTSGLYSGDFWFNSETAAARCLELNTAEQLRVDEGYVGSLERRFFVTSGRLHD